MTQTMKLNNRLFQCSDGVVGVCMRSKRQSGGPSEMLISGDATGGFNSTVDVSDPLI